MAESTPQNQSSLPTRASNRPSNFNQIRDQIVGPNSQDDIIARLEGTPVVKRGSRKEPSVLKYPYDIGSAQIPHVMQFKIFWRWERPDLKAKRDSLRAESQKTAEYLKLLSAFSTDKNGNFSVETFFNSPFATHLAPYMNEIASRKGLGTIVNDGGNVSVTGLLKTDPKAAKALIEETIKSEQTQVESIDKYGDEMVGKVSWMMMSVLLKDRL